MPDGRFHLTGVIPRVGVLDSSDSLEMTGQRGDSNGSGFASVGTSVRGDTRLNVGSEKSERKLQESDAAARIRAL